MIASREVCRAAARIKREYGTGDPFALARELRIEVLVRELGTLKGFYKDVYGTPFIFLSRRLTRGEARLVCAHELGHHLLHRQFAAFGFEEVSVFSPASRREYEANLFAAELVIPDDELFELLSDRDKSFFCIAEELYVPAELLDFKFRILKRKGYNFNIPTAATADFLKNNIPGSFGNV